VSPRDHLLHLSLASVYGAECNHEAAEACLKMAADAYTCCPKASLSLAKMYMAAGKPEQALERFDEALRNIGSRADDPSKAWMPLCAAAFDAKTFGAHAAVLCAEASESKDFVREQIPRIIRQLEDALSVAPGNEYVLGLLSRSKRLIAGPS